MIPLSDNVPARRFAFVTYTLIAVNIAIFIYEISLGATGTERLVNTYGVVPARLWSFPANPLVLLTLLTCMFLHGSWLHVLGNMLYLHIFGNNVEDDMGSAKFLVFYLFAGAVGSLVEAYFNPNSTIPTVGASGAIAGVLGAYLLYFPRARVMTLIPLFIIWPVIAIPAILVLGFWFVTQLFSSVSAIATTQQTMGGVAYLAHVGGFVTGLVLALPLRSRYGGYRDFRYLG